MKRILMQCYVKGSIEAVTLYKEAFGADIVSEYKNEDGTYLHSELNIEGHILAVAEVDEDRITGSTMQFCLHYEEEQLEALKHAYETLKEGSQMIHPLGPNFYSSNMTDFIDKFGIHWCMFV